MQVLALEFPIIPNLSCGPVRQNSRLPGKIVLIGQNRSIALNFPFANPDVYACYPTHPALPTLTARLAFDAELVAYDPVIGNFRWAGMHSKTDDCPIQSTRCDGIHRQAADWIDARFDQLHLLRQAEH